MSLPQQTGPDRGVPDLISLRLQVSPWKPEAADSGSEAARPWAGKCASRGRMDRAAPEASWTPVNSRSFMADPDIERTVAVHRQTWRPVADRVAAQRIFRKEELPIRGGLGQTLEATRTHRPGSAGPPGNAAARACRRRARHRADCPRRACRSPPLAAAPPGRRWKRRRGIRNPARSRPGGRRDRTSLR